MRINVLGLGNVMFGDEGFGVEVIRYLERLAEFPENVTLIDGGTQGIYLLDYLESAQRLLVFDAIIPQTYDRQVYVYKNDELPGFIYRKMSSHQVGLSELISLARLHGKTPEDLILIGIPPVSLNMGVGLTDEVRALVPVAARKGVEQIKAWGVDVSCPS
ncbi:MAG: HyaD/HybD family hydrogenase maturation endopeptidase [Fidelibacterota bacterium]